MKMFSVSYTPLRTYRIVPGSNPYREKIGEVDLDIEGVITYLKAQNIGKRAFCVQTNPAIPEEDREVLETKLRQFYPKFSGIRVLDRVKPQNQPE